jgi:hypothetical protein
MTYSHLTNRVAIKCRAPRSISSRNVATLRNACLAKRRKTSADPLELILIGVVVVQADLFAAARRARINAMYAREFLQILIAARLVLVVKVPRLKSKSALGYVRARMTLLSPISAPDETFGIHDCTMP